MQSIQSHRFKAGLIETNFGNDLAPALVTLIPDFRNYIADRLNLDRFHAVIIARRERPRLRMLRLC